MKKANRGPAATASNRAALMAAGRRIFAVEGLDVPLSSIAREAGVSQGVLYRHFPSRMDLAVAVFEQNMDAMSEAIRDRADEELGFTAAWRKLVELTVSDIAFIETAVHDSADPRVEQFGTDMRNMLFPLVEEAWEQGDLDRGITVEFLFVTLRAVYGLVTTSGERMEPVEQSVAELLEKLGLPVA